jgi:mannosyltransferase
MPTPSGPRPPRRSSPQRPQPDEDPSSNPLGVGPLPGLSPRGLAIALSALAAALRFSGLGRQSFWYDEAVSVALARHPIADLLAGRIKDQGNPPLYPVLLHLWMGAFGAGDGAVRGLSALLGALTVPVMLAVARQIVPERVAFLTATLLALSPFHLQMAQEARGYALLAFLAAACAWALLRALSRQTEEAPSWLGRWAPWGLVALTTAAMALTHYFGLVVGLGFALYMAVVHRRHRAVLLRAGVAYGVAALLFAFWIPALAQQIGLTGNLARSHESWFWHLLATPLTFTMGTALLWKDVAGDGATATNIGLRALAGGLGTLAAVIAAASGLRQIWRSTHQDRDRGIWLLLAWLVVPVALPALISLTGHPVYNGRYAIAASLPFLLFVAAGLDDLADRARVAVGGILVITMGAATFATLSWLGTGRPLKHQWRETAAFVELLRKPNDLLLFDADHNETAYAHYAGPEREETGRVRMLPPPVGASPGHLFGAFREGGAAVDVTDVVQGRDRVWLILSDASAESAARTQAFFAGWSPGPATQLRGIAIRQYLRPEN